MSRFAIALCVLLSLAGCSREILEPPAREGPPALVETAGAQTLWLATRQEGRREFGGGRRFKRVIEQRTYLRVQAHDPRSAQRLWTKELKLVVERSGDSTIVNPGPIRILGQQGPQVWLFVHDQLLVLSARDGSVLADRARLEQVNPDIAGLLAKEAKFHAWMDAPVAILADGRRVRFGEDFRASDYAPQDEQAFQQSLSMTTSWGGSFRTEDFGVRHSVHGGRWVGLFSEREAKDAANDQFGDHVLGSEWIADEGADARRRFWLAQTGPRGKTAFQQQLQADMREEFRKAGMADWQPEPYPEEREPRLVKLDPLGAEAYYLGGRMLKGPRAPGAPQWQRSGVSARPAPVEPLRVDGGVLVLHRTRLDAQGRLAIAALDADYRPRWRSELPYTELGNRWFTAGGLLLVGNRDAGVPGSSDWREALLALDTTTGRWRGWDIGAQEELASPAAGAD